MRLDMFPAREAFTETLQTATVIPVGMKILADAETPVSVLSRFANENANVFLFETVFVLIQYFFDKHMKLYFFLSRKLSIIYFCQ